MEGNRLPMAFLMGLNDVYENLRSQLLYREKRPTLEEAISAVRQEESRLRVSSETHGQNSAALLIKKLEVRASSAGNWTPRPSQPSQTLPAEGDDNRDLLVCNYCKKRRHKKENCWKLAWKNQNSGKRAYVTSSQLQNSPTAVMTPSIEEVQEKLSSTALVKSGNPPPYEWIADTGATDHMCPSGELFWNYSSSEKIHKVQTVGGGGGGG